MAEANNDGENSGVILLSAEARNYAMTQLTAEDQVVIEAYGRVHQAAVTSATVFTLGQTLELSPGVIDELSAKFSEQVRAGDKDRHQGVNQTLGDLIQSVDPTAELAPVQADRSLLGIPAASEAVSVIPVKEASKAKVASKATVARKARGAAKAGTTAKSKRGTARKTKAAPASAETVVDEEVLRQRFEEFNGEVLLGNFEDTYLDLDIHKRAAGEILQVYSGLKGHGLNVRRKDAHIQRLRMYFGLDGEPLSDRQIAAQTGLTNSTDVKRGRGKVMDAIKRLAEPKALKAIWDANFVSQK